MTGTGQPRTRFKFPRSSRLHRASEFGRVKAGTKSWTGRHLVLAVLQHDEHAPARIGIITARRIGEAVIRNRVRRRLRELFRKNQHRLCRGIWIVTIARASSATASFSDLERDWLRLIGRASILAPA
jgi:ribonuclease P protein component